MQIPPQIVNKWHILDRKWYIDRYVEQRNKENEAIKKESKRR